MASGAAFAADTSKDAPKDARSLEFEMMLRGHPDLEYRKYGMEAYARKDYERAMTLFRRAAYFGDKPSQGMIAEMYAGGHGVTRDMALAYAWMDLASERGYKDFVIRRERYWARMSEAERARSLEEGKAIYAEYGDAAAKPRFALQLRRESRQGVGSRTGFAGNARITIPSAFGDQSVDATQLRSVSYWDPEKYWKLQDAMWRNPGGKVEAGDLEDVRATQAAPSATKTDEPAAPESEPR
ncbi:sel1 repeat family protein [Cognatilysobacter xinjiangensis]|nr:sel1 repeat family protein [Lysobacter xinjiangensis]